MAWDANRPVPWRRLAREATIFLVIGAVALTLLVKHRQVGTYTGLVIGMVFYVAFVALLSKFGYERQSIRQARDRRQAMAAARPAAAADGATRQRPAPTRRTTTGPSQRPNRSTKKRRR
ncbi:MAG: hypothetical protein QOJ74_983 [Ilumatobacteraceae bacterium]|nr:hypothetical protein [Ilumatobacteraceae bacterium]